MDNNWQKLEYSREKSLPVPLFPPQLKMTGLGSNFMVRMQQLTALIMAQLCCAVFVQCFHSIHSNNPTVLHLYGSPNPSLLVAQHSHTVGFSVVLVI